MKIFKTEIDDRLFMENLILIATLDRLKTNLLKETINTNGKHSRDTEQRNGSGN